MLKSFMAITLVVLISACASFNSVQHKLSDKEYGYWSQQWYKSDNPIYKKYFEKVKNTQCEGKVLKDEGYPDLIDVNQFNHMADKRIWLYLAKQKMYVFNKGGTLEASKTIPFSDMTHLSNLTGITIPKTESDVCEECIDVIGLTPGISTIEDFKKAGEFIKKTGDKYITRLTIGGYVLPCGGLFSFQRLGMMSCITGESYTKGTNLEIHEVLVNGFTKKFGPPESIKNTPVRTRMGVEYNSNEVTWKDKRGNVLIIKDLDGKIDKGSLMVLSADMWNSILEQAKGEVRERRF